MLFPIGFCHTIPTFPGQKPLRISCTHACTCIRACACARTRAAFSSDSRSRRSNPALRTWRTRLANTYCISGYLVCVCCYFYLSWCLFSFSIGLRNPTPKTFPVGTVSFFRRSPPGVPHGRRTPSSAEGRANTAECTPTRADHRGGTRACVFFRSLCARAI